MGVEEERDMRTRKINGLKSLINFPHWLSLSDNYVRFLEPGDSIFPTARFASSSPECLLSHLLSRVDCYIFDSLRECEYPIFWIRKLYKAPRRQPVICVCVCMCKLFSNCTFSSNSFKSKKKNLPYSVLSFTGKNIIILILPLKGIVRKWHLWLMR